MEKKRKRKIGGLFLLLCCLVLVWTAGSTAEAKTVKLNKTNLILKKKQTYQLRLNGAKGKIKWKSSKKSVATVSSSGKIKAVKPGKCTIKAVYKGKVYKCSLQVKTANQYILDENPPKKNKGKIILAGSSSMRRWLSAPEAFAPYEVVNVGISGTTAEQWSKWYKTMIVPYEPDIVAFYVGGNDLWRRTTPAKTAKLVCNTMKKIGQALPDVKLYFISVCPNTKRKVIAKQITSYNKIMKQFCAKNENITYIDVASHFPKSGKALDRLLADGLHPNEKGYKIWKQVVAAKIKSDIRNGNQVSNDVVDSITDSDLVESVEQMYQDELNGEVENLLIS